MIDFRQTTTVPKNFDIEKVLTENHNVQVDNNVLVVIGITTAVLVIALSIYIAKEEAKKHNKFRIVVN